MCAKAGHGGADRWFSAQKEWYSRPLSSKTKMDRGNRRGEKRMKGQGKKRRRRNGP